MWDKQYIGQDLTSFSNNGQFHGISRVTFLINDETSVTAGDDFGIEILAECPFATQAMAQTVLESIKGYKYQTYSAESANMDPAAELGDGVTAGGVYSVISQINDSGDGYPSISAPGESELQDEYPIVGPGTQEFNRRIASVKQWAEENNKALKDDIENAMEESGKLITGQLGGHYIVTMNPENGKPNGWALMDTESLETAKNIWRATLGGIGHYSNGINSTPNMALTMDGKINASMILTGELWANLIKSGRIESRKGNVYFDLDANGGKGELAASVLRGVEDGTTTTARIGIGTYAGGEAYEGVSVSTTSGAGGDFLIALQRNADNFGYSNKTDLAASGNLSIRSLANTSSPIGQNSIDMYGNSDTSEGEVTIYRGKRGGSEVIFHSGADNSHVSFKNNDILWGDSSHTTVSFNGKNILESNASNLWLSSGGQKVFHGGSDNSSVNFKNKDILWGDSSHTTVSFNGKNLFWGDSSQTLLKRGDNIIFQGISGATELLFKSGSNTNYVSVGSTKIEFGVGGYARASIENNGAYFSDLYTNGVKVTSDRQKKENISALKASALDLVRKAKVYDYTLKETGGKHTGIMYDEAPECIRSEGEEKAVDLYSMVSLLWKAVQELEKKIDNLTEGE